MKKKLKSTIYGLFFNPNILTVESLNYFISISELWIGHLRTTLCCVRRSFLSTPSAKKKSIQRSELWQKIAENLNSVKDPCFIVEKRSVRDHIAILIQRFTRQQAQELRESGMSHQHTELDATIEQTMLSRNPLILNSKKWMTRTAERWGLIEKKQRICIKRH